jgi:hypothetical protein
VYASVVGDTFKLRFGIPDAEPRPETMTGSFYLVRSQITIKSTTAPITMYGIRLLFLLRPRLKLLPPAGSPVLGGTVLEDMVVPFRLDPEPIEGEEAMICLP